MGHHLYLGNFRRAARCIGIAVLANFSLSACVYVSKPFTASEAFKKLPAAQEIIVSVTHVVLSDNKDEAKKFWTYNQDVIDSLPENNGYLGHKLRLKLFSGEAWTLTVWDDRDALGQFVFGDVHNTAMFEAMSAVARGRSITASFSVDQVPPSWEDLEKLMDAEGRNLLANSDY